MGVGVLELIGLSRGEAKTYLALVELGSATVIPLSRKAGVTASKIYPIMDRLVQKGFATTIIKNNVKQFQATNPARISDYLQKKREAISEQEQLVQEWLPKLEAVHKQTKADVIAEMFVGWKGMKTAYNEMLNSLERGDNDYVLGASKGMDRLRTRRFYDYIQAEAYKRGITVHIISQANIRGHFEQYKGPKRHVRVRYIATASHAETNICKDTVMIVIHTLEPVVIKIRSKEVADSYLQYFKELWNVAKK